MVYDVVFSENGRIYLNASFTPASCPAVPALDDLLAQADLRVLALDLNTASSPQPCWTARGT